MIIGGAPTLATIYDAYGEATLYDLLNSFILDYVVFCGMANRTSAMQIDNISHTIFNKYHFLKVTEIMLFFCMAKNGELVNSKGENVARMYGTFNGEVLTNALLLFKQHRDNVITITEQQKAKANIDNWESAKSTFVAPLLKQMREDWEKRAAEQKRKDDEEMQRKINEHNKQFLAMLKAREELNK